MTAEPIEPFTEAEIVRYARGVVTNEYLVANVGDDQDWQHSMMLLLSAWDPDEIPPNLSTCFLVPLAPHQAGRWLNGRVPGVTISAVPVAMESLDPLNAKITEMWQALNPDVVIPTEKD